VNAFAKPSFRVKKSSDASMFATNNSGSAATMMAFDVVCSA
jgi:hypothetical protein